jgi:hypothetical protein
MKTWSHKTRRERSAASLSGQHGLKRASRVLAGHGQHGCQEYGSMDSCTLTICECIPLVAPLTNQCLVTGPTYSVNQKSSSLS